MKRAAKNKLLDKIHRGVVYTCIGLTLYGGYLLSLRAYRHFTVIRPEMEARELKMIEEAKRLEGHIGTELDKSPDLRA